MAGTAVVDPAPERGRVSVGSTIATGIALLAGIMFFVLAAVPYANFTAQQFGLYWPRRWWLVLHIGGGTLALFIAPVQLWLGINRRRLELHRRLGLTYMTGVAIGSIGAYYLAFHTDGPWVFGSGLAALATAWVATTALAFIAISRRKIQQHEEWMIRSAVVTFAFVFFRVLLRILQVSHIGTLEEDLAIAAWASWAVPLLLAEVWLQGRKVFA